MGIERSNHGCSVSHHTFGKNLVDRGGALDRVAAILGHEDLNVTAIYTRPSQNDLAGEVAKTAWEEE